MVTESLQWDSQFFGLDIGAIQINDHDDIPLEEFDHLLENRKYKLLYIFSNGKPIPFEIAQKYRLNLVDVQALMERDANLKIFEDLHFEMKNDLSRNELIECYKIAESTAEVSRFNNDRKININAIKGLYRKWIDNALNGEFSDGIFVEKIENEVAGIHLIKTDRKNKIGHFTLTGVSPNSQGKGIGSRLWKQSFSFWSNKTDILKIQSKFSIHNLSSMNFHLKMGFNRTIGIKYIYHMWI